MLSRDTHTLMANALRVLSMDAVEAAKSGHPGLPMGAADVATVLFSRFLKFDPADPAWPDRDRFVLSAGHGSMLLYSLLHLTGYASVSMDDIRKFRQLHSRTPGHPENFVTEGIETTTGPLGQGLANAVGMALAERMLAAEFGDAVVDHRTYVLCSDGDLMEGISQEALAIAGHLRLNKLIVLWDDNDISIDGPISLSDSTDQLARFAASGWATTRVNGHDPDAIAAAIESAQASDRPTLIACRTVIGFGSPNKAGTSGVHGAPLGAAEIAGAREAFGWSAAPFELPDAVVNAWRQAGSRSASVRADWEARLNGIDAAKRAEFLRRVKGELPAALEGAFERFRAHLFAEPQEIATRKASELTIGAFADALPEFVSGSADLTGSNNTKVKALKDIAPGDFAGRFVHWGIREHGMAAAMNGMALHGGLLPASGTFLVFSDYCRPSLRLAALMGVGVIHVFTHDSIGVGEDGPTHQPVEHLAALRAIPNLLVFRPADMVETAESWQTALGTRNRPSVLALTRQNLPQLRIEAESVNRTARGGYELAAASGEAKVSIFASGSEVSLAMEARKTLEEGGIPTRVVSVPCLDLLLEQDEAYLKSIIGTAPVRVGVEAAIRMGWDPLIGDDGIFVGMSGYGASGPYKAVFEHFGITADAVVQKARARLGA